MLKLIVDGVTLEGETLDDIKGLVELVPLLRSGKKLASASSEEAEIPAATVVPLKTEGRIRRTQDELARGLTLEQAIAERRKNAGLPPLSETEAAEVAEDDDTGGKVDAGDAATLADALDSGEFHA